jgi:YD repeat-containing protein
LASLALAITCLTPGVARADRPAPAADPVTAGDPVRLSTGAFTYRNTDAGVPFDDPGPTIERLYDSRSEAVGPFGVGWSMSYNVYLQAGDDSPNTTLATAQVLELVGSTGTLDRYRRNASGGYTSTRSSFRTIEQEPGGSFVLNLFGEPAERFDRDGLLTAIIDEDGQVTTFERDALGQLRRINDSLDRGAIRMDYDPVTGRLVTIVDWVGRVSSYGYDELGRLISHTDRTGATEHYTYDGDSDHLQSIVDPMDKLVVMNWYDAAGEGRVVRQQDGRGWLTGAEYGYWYEDNEDGTHSTTVTYPASSYGPGAQAERTSIFDDQNQEQQRIWQISANDEPIVSGRPSAASFLLGLPLGRSPEQDAFAQRTRFSDSRYPVQPENISRPAGLVWNELFDAEANLQRDWVRALTGAAFVVDESGVTRDPMGRITAIALPSGGLFGGAAVWQATYDDEDRVLSLEVREGPLGLGRRAAYRYDAAGNLVAVTGTDREERTLIYDERSDVVEIRSARGVLAQYEYDDREMPTAATWRTKDGRLFHIALEIDGIGRIQRIAEYPNWPSTAGATATTYSYDDDGRHREDVARL